MTTVDTIGTRTAQHREMFADFTHLLDRPRIPARNALGVDEVVALPATLPTWQPELKQNHGTLRGLRLLLGWLEQHPGEGWQQRWVNSGADRDMTWVARLAVGDPRHPRLARGEIVRGLSQLLLVQVVLPSYDFLTAYRANGLFDWIREISRPDLFAAIDQAAQDSGIPTQHHLDGLRVLSKIVLHTGRHLGDLTSDDVLEVFAWAKQHHRPARPVPGLHTAWQLASAVGITPAGSTLRGAVLHGQRSTADLVDDYRLQCRPVRDVLVRYLDERRPSMDYNSFRDLVMVLASLFWADLEKHHPGIDSLRIPEDVAETWRNRLRTVVAPDGTTRPRVDILRIVAPVRFLAHFEKRKVSVGTCARAFGSSCIHEHACVRCSLLRPDPAQRPRLEEIRDNLEARIIEAKREGWLGEVEGLQVSYSGAKDKIAQIDATLQRQAAAVQLGLPTFPQTAGRAVTTEREITTEP